MRKLFRFAAVAAFMLQGGAALSAPFTGLVAFGDSYTTAERLVGLNPPSVGGRFSNGVVWYDLVAERFADSGLQSYNMAIGGATAGPDNTNDPLYLAYDATVPTDPSDPNSIPLIALRNFDAQIDSFLTRGLAGDLGDNPYAAVFLGGNDFLQDDTKSSNPLSVITPILDGITKLATLAPAYDDFLLFNLPDLVKIPGNAGLSAKEKDALTLKVQTFNGLLSAGAQTVDDIEGIEIFDTFSIFDDIFDEAEIAGINTSEFCTNTLTGTADFNLCPTPASADGFLFIDPVHVTNFAQSRIGDAVLAQLDGHLPAPVPLPAGLPLLLVGLGGFAILRRRGG